VLPPRLELRPSRWLLIWTGALHLLTAIVILLVPLPALLKTFGYLIIAGSLWFYFHRDYQSRGRCSYSELRPQNIKHWHLLKSSGTEEKAELLQHQVFRFLVVLDFILDSGKRCRVLIPEDAVDKENHRRLRAALRTDTRLDSAK
jgi:hypothetical protein